MTDIYKNIPDELAELNQWCCFKKEWDDDRDKFTKRPYNPNTGMFAKSNDPATWSDFDTAIEQSHLYDGIGFFFHNDYYGVDLDNVESEINRYLAGDLSDNIVAEFIETIDSYAEISPSGTGVHVIARGSLPKGGRRKGSVEMYDSGRFFTMTGNRISENKGIQDDRNVGRINMLHHKYIGDTTVSVEDLSNIQTDGNDLTIDEIIEEGKNNEKTGVRFKLFMDGGWEQFYDSQSEADMAFANDLAFWTARDFEKMDSIFRRSSLMRGKWDSKREDKTYGYITLVKAIQECQDTYQPFTLKISDEALKGTFKKRQKSFSYDDTGNSGRFLYAFQDNVLYSYTNKIWYYYANKYWAEDTVGKVYGMADYIADSVVKEPVRVAEDADDKVKEQAEKAKQAHVKRTRSFKGKEQMLKDVQHHVAVADNQFDQHGLLFNVQNGYIDLANGQLMEHQRNKYFTRISYAEYNKGYECPLWLKFLDETFSGDQGLIEYIQRAIGYSMSSDMSEQVMFILLGNGRNGKSVFLNVMRDVFGTYAMNIQPSTITAKGTQNANQDIARLKGARFVTTTEPNRGMKLDEGVVKQMTGGDVMTARFLYGKEFEFHPEFKIWMATNYKPVISGTDDGIWRRMAIIPFENQIPIEKVDKKLEFKLKQETAGILNWCIEGYQKWRLDGLGEPDVIEQQRHDYRTEMDIVARFIEETCDTTDKKAETKAKDLWEAFKSWVEESNEYDKFSAKRFYMELEKLHEKKRKSDGMYYIGIKLSNIAVNKNIFSNIPEIG